MSLTLLTRAGCELCEHMQTDLVALGQQIDLPPIVVEDVDADPERQRRYGLKVPVLLLDGAMVCFGQLREDELRRLLARRNV